MGQEVPSEAYSLASAEVEGAAESLEASVTLGLALGKAEVHGEILLGVVAALAQLAFVQVSQSSVAPGVVGLCTEVLPFPAQSLPGISSFPPA